MSEQVQADAANFGLKLQKL